MQTKRDDFYIKPSDFIWSGSRTPALKTTSNSTLIHSLGHIHVMGLPTPSNNQPFCTVSALHGGEMSVAEELFITDATPGSKMTAPSLCFMINHSEKPQRFLFDLGIRSDTENYPPNVQKILAGGFSVDATQNCLQDLEKAGTKPADIDFVCISHCHFDHVGNTHAFNQSTFVVGGECRSLLEKGYPHDPDANYAADLLPADRTQYISDADWKPVGPFPSAFDFYGDGSLYIVDSPGHLHGHVNILARTSSDGAWIYLAGDSAHHWKILTGESQIKVGAPWDPNFCMHVDKAKAEEHIGRIREIWKTPRVRVLLAHDGPWYKENEGGPAFWPGKIESL
ncbi:hypothetical protein GALMADRAFT_145700 [Galerina marginata CBS 339.88]|uniref:Metallo-beta-lactamase domain-containing protein n=1 Tax=Galerina marginata (strain CBS 339.88) TaxID=685588 RepID=A0A067SNP4_GALM3|nr:hypothetical protein GALMADRAFT_145700 [Galerina marginata CBS 339.88]